MADPVESLPLEHSLLRVLFCFFEIGCHCHCHSAGVSFLRVENLQQRDQQLQKMLERVKQK